MAISFAASFAVALAAATTAATVPNFAEPLPPKELTASLCALNTSCAALLEETNQDRSFHYNDREHGSSLGQVGKQREFKYKDPNWRVETQARATP